MKKLPRSEVSFTFSRSSGAGGQNVNKVNSKAMLHWNLNTSSIPEEVKGRFRERYSGFITAEGEVQIISQETRNQKDNVEDCFERLERMLEQVWRAPKKRKATKPTWGSVQKRLQGKKLDSIKKQLRKKDF
jgi:ribosome-associated protein